MSKKTLCVLVDDDSKYYKWNSKKPFVQEVLNESYSRFSNTGKKHGIKVVFTKYTNCKNQKIKRYWHFNKKWEKHNEEIKPDLFFDKFPVDKKSIKLKKILGKEKIVFNNYHIEELCKDKLKQAKLFSKLVPKTYFVKNKTDFKNAVKKIKTNKVILKPRFGYGGIGIKVYDKEKPFTKNNFKLEYVAQEFIDTSKGIPKLKINGIHDVRCIVINDKVSYSFVREPRSGLLANVHQGGKATEIKIQKELVEKIKDIDLKLKKYGNRVYSVDFFYSNGKYYLVELNSKPGFDIAGRFGFKKSENKFFNDFFEKIFSKII